MDIDPQGLYSYIGVDPGSSGGLAVLYSTGRVETYKMPYTDSAIIDLLGEFKRTSYRPLIAVLESIPPAMGQGTSKTNMSLVYGSFRGLRMALTAYGIDIMIVRSEEVWRSFDIDPRYKGETTRAWKGRLKYKAQSLFPDLKVTKAVSDALLFAEYGKRYKTGTLKTSTIPLEAYAVDE